MKFKLPIIGLALLFVGGLGFFLPMLETPVQAQATQPVCNELQIVFLMDQSGSMGGAKAGNPYHPIPNDPDELRFYAVKHAIETLGPLRYGSHPDATIRVAMVNFGTRPEPGFSWTTITPTNESEWKSQYALISPDIQSTRWITRNLGGTNFVRAFQAAGSQFSQVTPQVGNCPYRAILLFTDGKPEIDTQEDPQFTVEKHFNELQSYVIQNLPKTELYVIAISKDAYWNDTKSFWLKIAGDENKLKFIEKPEDVGLAFQEIMDKLTGKLPGPPVNKVSICPGQVSIPPYLQWVSFSLYKTSGQEDHLQISDAKGFIDQTRTDVKTKIDGYDGPIETFQIDQPLPGTWVVNTLRGRSQCDLDMRSITAIGRLVSPNPNGDPVVQFASTPITFTIGDAAGGAMPDYGPGYDLKIQAKVKDLTGIEDLAIVASGRNVYTAQYIPIEVGLHDLEVYANAIDASNAITVVNQPIASFKVDPAKLTLLEGPKASGSLPQYSPISITLALAGQNKKPAQIALPIAFEVTIAQGTQGQPLTMTPNPDGTFGASFTPQNAGSYRLIYQGTVTLPNGTKKQLGGEDIAFNVYPTTALKASIVKPSAVSPGAFEAADPLGLSAGLVFEVQLADANGNPVPPGQVVDGDPMNVFQLKVTDSNRKDRSSELRLGLTAQPGLFRAESKTLEPGEYNIEIKPVAKLKQQYAWSANSWIYKVNGNYPLAFLGVVLLAGIVLFDFGTWGVRWLLSRPHPFRGTLTILEVKEDDPGEDAWQEGGRRVWSKTLPRANYAKYRDGWHWLGPIPWYYRDFKSYKKLNIKSIEVRSESQDDVTEGKVRVKVEKTNNKTVSMVLHRGTVDDRQPIDYGFSIYLK